MGLDLVTVEQPADALSQQQIETFLRDLHWEANDWRYVADREADYYDNKQLDAEVLQIMEDRGVPPLTRNLIGPAIDSALGMEAKNRRDMRVVADSDDKDEQLVAEALNVKFSEAQRVARFNRASSECYKGQISVGVAWMGINRPLDPFEPKYRAEPVNRREIFWDMRGQRSDTYDWRWLIRKRWYDVDQLTPVFPKHADLIRSASHLWADWDSEMYTGRNAPQMLNGYDQFTNTGLEAMEWLDTDRERVALYEAWYRIWKRAQVFYLNDVVFEFDPKNEYHQVAVQSGRARLESTVISKVRLAYWLGPHQIMDMPTPYPHNRFPYVPFFGMREDRTGVPYGLIRRMMSPQDEVNARLSRMMWALSARRVVADSDAFDMSEEEVLDEVARSDSFLQLNPNRTNKDSKPDITTDHQLARDQFMVMQSAENYLFAAVGSHGSFRGERQPGLESGVAVQQLIEQSATTLNEINDNYLDARLLASELLLSLVKQDIGATPLPVSVLKGNKRTTVVLNEMSVDDEGNEYRSNNIAQIRVRMDVEEVPSTASYRQQQYVQLAEVIKAAPPEMQSLLTHLLIQASDLPPRLRDEAVALIKGHLGLSDDDPEFEAAQKEAQLRAQALAAQEQTAEIQKTVAETRKLMAQVEEIASKIAASQQKMSIDEDQRQMALDRHEPELKELEGRSAQPGPVTEAKAKPAKKAS